MKAFFTGTFLFTLLLSSTGGRLFAQDTTNVIGNVTIASPTAAALAKYADLPVGYNTGITSTGVPIYTVESGTLKLPVGLSYHASGIRVEEMAGWVGAGWSLNAGGVITRKVNGMPDDRGVGSATTCTNGYYSDYGNNSYQFIYTPGQSGAAFDGYSSDDLSFQRGYKDAEPDLYFFNFCGYIGKFYFNDDRTPVVVPESDLKIQPDLQTGAGNLGFQGFIVTTPDGTKYYFGKTGNTGSVDPVEITTPTLEGGPASQNSATSSWYLNKVVSADGTDVITFTYQQENYSYYSFSLSPVTNTIGGGTLNPTTGGMTPVKNFIQGVRLTGIQFANGNLQFLPSSSPRQDLSGYNPGSTFSEVANTNSYSLGSVLISGNSGFCSQYNFYYGYFLDPAASFWQGAGNAAFTATSDKYVLRLDSIQQISCDLSLKLPPYKFAYYQELVPRRLSLCIDHWGYSNGVTGNITLIPSYTLVNYNGNGSISQQAGANRDAAWPAMRGGSLQRVTYPTGGYMQLDYEPNQIFSTYQQSIVVNLTPMTAGLTLDQPTTTMSVSSTGGSYSAHLQNSDHGTGYLMVTNSVGTTIVNQNVNSNSVVDLTFVLSPGNYTFTLHKTVVARTFVPGDGIVGSFSTLNLVSTQGNLLAGGLRISSITNNDGRTPNDVVTSYLYTVGGTANGNSSGILYNRPVYVQSIKNAINATINGAFCSPNGCYSCADASTYLISPGSLTPLSSLQGAPVGYNEVTVLEGGNGHTTFKFHGSDYWDGITGDVCTRSINTTACTADIPNFPAVPLVYEPARGALVYTGVTNKYGTVLKESSYVPQFSMDPIATPAIRYNRTPGLYTYTPYVLQSARLISSKALTTTYDSVSAQSLSTTTTMYYGSAYHHSPTRVVKSTSTTDSMAVNTKYAFDFRIASCDATADNLPGYLSSVHSDSLTLQSDLAACPISSGAQCTYTALQNFRRRVNLDRQNFVSYRRSNFTDPNSQQATCYLNSTNTADVLLKPVLQLQAEYANPAIEISSFKDLNLLHAQLNLYTISSNPAGFAYPLKSQLLNLATPSSSFAAAAASGNSLATDSRYLDEASYSFSSGRLQQSLPHNGVAAAYIWGYANSVPVAVAQNATPDQIAFSSFENDGNGSWSIASGTRDAGGITGTQSYNLANGAVSKSGLISTQTYTVSYWSKTGSAYAVTGSTGVKTGKTINGWTYIEHQVSGVSSVTVTGAGDIDELRLYPRSGQMTSYVYTPLVGTSSVCDVSNKISYYSYDSLGRVLYVKDQDGNIVKTYDYHFKQDQSN